MRWAVVGSKGLFGSELVAYLAARGEAVVGFGRSNIDLEASVHEVGRVLAGFDVVVNAAGYTNVDGAETNLFEASKVNGLYAGKMARALSDSDTRFFHISSDYVFDGAAQEPYKKGSAVNPQSEYGESKLLGEQLVADSGANFTIFRTAWLYGANGKCFPKTIAAKLLGDKAVRVVNDQIGSPTWVADLAEVIYSHGVSDFDEHLVHAVASGSTTWFDFARVIAESLPEGQYSISPVSSAEFVTPARRPAYSVLENSDTKGPIIGDWLERWSLAAPSVLASVLAKQSD